MLNKVLFFIFITIVSISAQGKDYIYKDLLAKAEKYAESGDKEKANYYITRFVGLVLNDSSTKVKVEDIDGAIKKLGLQSTAFISGKYSSGFLDWYFASTYYMWGCPDELTNEDDLSSIITSASDDNYFIGIIAHPVIEEWMVTGGADGKNSSSFVNLIDNSNPPKIFIKNLKDETKEPVIYVLKNYQLYYQYFWRPILKDINNDGKPEIIQRYNLARGDGFYQQCDVYSLSDTSLSFLDSITGDPEGFAWNWSGNKFQTGHAFPGSGDIGHLAYNLFEINNYEFKDGKFHKVSTEKPVENILWSDKFEKYFFER